jgi:two-component system response regulator PhoP
MSRQELKVSDAAVELTSFEYKIIEYLMVRAGQVISKTELTDRLYDQDFERDSNVIEVFIGRLRKKMDPDNTIKPIETLRGRGYRFALERNQSD